ncbi:cytochrome c oxidase subunit II [Maritimibacter sp. UBA3975]|uniref:cytochrome c oxidase subunit II n=1 Tax=Maritimibacter sp. UBA3975 TaxID=1946833 RepID=UPI000C09D940|nr:cytochrome c oxidase subunit II [Maritimibacter sp. UBA3975]MAM60756.1 cytochrome c oxidase subunit II [Maritimibacter sp.]|tara:strand:- start:14862 stop:15722 length:861 start_codon:yes stop_codon:yes gene_type:complete
MTKTLRPLALLAATFSGAAAWAQDVSQELEVIGAPTARGTGFQPAATDIARATFSLDTMLLYIIIAISVFVAALIIWVILRYNRAANKTPGTFTHNTGVEIAWTLIPIVILVFIGAQSLPVLFKQQEIPEGDVVIKATGYQWYWGYEYVDEEFGFDSFMLGRDELGEYGYDDDLYRLATDTAVVVPTGKKIVVQVTGADVIHAWTVPAFGVKQDAVPGRLAELWFTVDEGMEGIYFGQCSELCGKDHAFMPITVKAVSQEAYDAWLEEARAEYAGIPAKVQVASAE